MMITNGTVSRPLTRIEPQLPPGLMHTHLILAPVATHFRKATCAEVDCPHYLEGWWLRTDALPAEQVELAKRSGRRFREVHVSEGENYLAFEAGQPCFKVSAHRKRLDRPELFVKQEGDYRGNPRGLDPVRFSGADAWADSLGSNLDQIARRR